MPGPSPQTRGTLNRPASELCMVRSIPANAGNTTHVDLSLNAFTVHPRKRGEHNDPDILFSSFSGPSPQTRGTRRGRMRAISRVRSIPANAGNTQDSHGYKGVRSVHPRKRGEHCRTGFQMRAGCGPSPQTRGTRPCAGGRRGGLRSIPANAGNT